jgi:hypothetical protein
VYRNNYNCSDCFFLLAFADGYWLQFLFGMRSLSIEIIQSCRLICGIADYNCCLLNSDVTSICTLLSLQRTSFYSELHENTAIGIIDVTNNQFMVCFELFWNLIPIWHGFTVIIWCHKLQPEFLWKVWYLSLIRFVISFRFVISLALSLVNNMVTRFRFCKYLASPPK